MCFIWFGVRFICVLVVLVPAELAILNSATAATYLLTSSYALAEKKLRDKKLNYEILILACINLRSNKYNVKIYVEL